MTTQDKIDKGEALKLVTAAMFRLLVSDGYRGWRRDLARLDRIKTYIIRLARIRAYIIACVPPTL